MQLELDTFSFIPGGQRRTHHNDQRFIGFQLRHRMVLLVNLQLVLGLTAKTMD
jgi:hypothetical protein